MAFLNRWDSDLIGLVLVGGKSSRMKQAKAYLAPYERPQWETCYKLLSLACCEVFFSTSQNLSPALPVANDKIINDVFVDPIGPLGGMISAFKRKPNRPILVLACDLLLFDEKALGALMKNRDGNKKATAFIGPTGIEPLCTIYEPSIFSDLCNSWARGMYCPREILKAMKDEVELIKPIEKDWTTNINTEEEYQRLKATFGRQKKINLHYYAHMKEYTGKTQEEFYTSAPSVGQLFNEIREKYSIEIDGQWLRFAKNDQMVNKSSSLNHGDSIVFITPVSGG